MVKVLISDKMDPLAAEIFQKNGIEVDVRPGMSAEDLLAIIGDYDGLAVRSSTMATPEMIGKAANLKVIGRAGIGIDNIDLEAATNQGVIVMNTPFGNSITTAEHAIALMFALARQIPQANQSTHAGKWEKSKFMGTELYAKTLGVIGCGNIGAIAASRALGLQMNVIAYDPFLSEDRAIELGVEKVELDNLLSRADFITLHVPKNEHTKNLINKKTISKMKDGVRIINCARGGIIVEADLKEALDSGKVAGAALDVFEIEPATENLLFGHPNVICTPHLGASTCEAQVNVAIQVAEQMSDYLINGAIMNALNMPSISAEDAPRLKPYMKLAGQLGSLIGQITTDAIKSVIIEYEGSIAELNSKPLTALAIASLLKTQLDNVNMVNAMKIAQSRGINISETKTGSSQDFRSLMTIKIKTESNEHIVAGTLFTGKEPRIVNIEGVPIEAALAPHMLYIRNEDKPGLIGGLGTLLAEAGQNIADFRLGRIGRDETAVALVILDQELPDDVFSRIERLPQIRQVQRLKF
ncbi:MAG: phosphoglycerate dehydrogenase [Alphaproteobacteria bacterium CG_4_9_14_3_um_filter_47_13]|nr:MAG: phosphoglycerate dehydrogenase [Alphaproteobacteria bacterium CG_4_9_14_3_um_filter_47_13]